jgi:plasmid maintenance system antidote protein VapI
MPDITQGEALKRLKEFVGQFETKAEAARELEISQQYLFDILAGNRTVSDKVARKLGYRKEVVYKKIE